MPKNITIEINDTQLNNIYKRFKNNNNNCIDYLFNYMFIVFM